MMNLNYYRQVKKYTTHQHAPFFLLVKKYLRESSKILDVGGGDGAFAEIIGRTDTYILDGNHQTVEKLKIKYPNVQYGQLPVLPYQDKFFSMIHCSHIVEHLHPEQLYDFMKEADRCLMNDGYLIISTPLPWSGFYDDLSHVKPYSPMVFKKYFALGNVGSATRTLVSDKYVVKEEVFRYAHVHEDEFVIFEKTSFPFIPFIILYKLASKIKNLLGVRRVEKSGYTLVLQKQA
jgi:SAM-dependent methyltransferase